MSAPFPFPMGHIALGGAPSTHVPRDVAPAAIARQARPDYQQRVIDEAVDLGGKLSRLNVFIDGSPVFSAQPAEERARLVRQRVAMTDYLLVLRERIHAFGGTQP